MYQVTLEFIFLAILHIISLLHYSCRDFFFRQEWCDLKDTLMLNLVTNDNNHIVINEITDFVNNIIYITWKCSACWA